MCDKHIISHLSKPSQTHLLSQTGHHLLTELNSQNSKTGNGIELAWGQPGQKPYFKMQALTVEWEVQGFEHLWGCSFHKHRSSSEGPTHVFVTQFWSFPWLWCVDVVWVYLFILSYLPKHCRCYSWYRSDRKQMVSWDVLFISLESEMIYVCIGLLSIFLNVCHLIKSIAPWGMIVFPHQLLMACEPAQLITC